MHYFFEHLIVYVQDDTKGSMDEPGAACVSRLQELQRTEESEEYLVPEEHEQLLEPGEESLRLVEEPSQNNKDTDTEDETDEEMEIQSWRGERYLREQFLKNPTTVRLLCIIIVAIFICCLLIIKLSCSHLTNSRVWMETLHRFSQQSKLTNFFVYGHCVAT